MIVALIHKNTSSALSAIIADFRGISVNTITKLRKKALKSDVTINVVKNTLLKKALKNTNFNFFSKKIKGPTLIAFSMKHPGSAAKLFKNFEKENTQFKIKLAAFENKILSNLEIEKLALMPTYNEALVQIMTILKEITVGILIMSISTEQILEAISQMSVKNIIELISAMEKKFNVSATIPVQSSSLQEPKLNTEKTEFNVFLKSIGPNKISIIKTIRSANNLGLKEAKDLVESAPVLIKENINKEDSQSLKKVLEDNGATVEIK